VRIAQISFGRAVFAEVEKEIGSRDLGKDIIKESKAETPRNAGGKSLKVVRLFQQIVVKVPAVIAQSEGEDRPDLQKGKVNNPDKAVVR